MTTKPMSRLYEKISKAGLAVHLYAKSYLHGGTTA